MEVPSLIHVDAYFDLPDLRHPSGIESAMMPLVEQELLIKQDNGRYAITNLEALLLAKKDERLPGAAKKTAQDSPLCQKQATSKFSMIKPIPTDTLSPTGIRELLSNTTIHQDLTDTGCGPRADMYNIVQQPRCESYPHE